MNAEKIEQLLKSAKIELVVEQDENEVRGNFCSDDAQADRELEDSILERLDRGDVWAWFCVKVVATLTIDDTQYRGESDWLGGCSYENEADFSKPGDYCDDMKATALDRLSDQLNNRPLDPSDIAITRDEQRQALADLVNRKLAYRSREIESIREQLLAILK